jgi:hypothetical protein
MCPRSSRPRRRLAPPVHAERRRQPSAQATPAKIATATYYDTVNFAKRLKVPGYYNWGYNDETCPPTAAYAAYNLITAPKTLGLTLETRPQLYRPSSTTRSPAGSPRSSASSSPTRG